MTVRIECSRGHRFEAESVSAARCDTCGWRPPTYETPTASKPEDEAPARPRPGRPASDDNVEAPWCFPMPPEAASDEGALQ